uniref:Ig-like domain-containing protein n=1 Tax=Astyanax mexicanus TaxID=7994 RepID=A0A8B9GTK2_ASTMX
MALYQQESLVIVEHGESITLQCTVGKKSSDLFLWYKERLGHAPQQVGMVGSYSDPIIFPPFHHSGFKIERTENTISLTILRATKEDEGMYFCGLSLVNVITFYNGMFLAVSGN